MSRDDRERVLNQMIDLAQQHLQKRGGFYSFAFTTSADGQENLVAGYTGEEHPDDEEIVRLILHGQAEAAAAGEIKSFALCEDVRITHPETEQWTRAIKITLEDEDEPPVICYLPFEESRRGLLRSRAYNYGEIIAVPAEPKVFTGRD